jgi:hypothetical protein
MHVFLKVTGRRGSSHRTQILHRGLQEIRNVVLDLFAQSWSVQRLQQGRVFNMRKSAAQGAFHNVVIDHHQPRFLGELCESACRLAPLIRFSIREARVISDSDNDLWGQ